MLNRPALLLACAVAATSCDHLCTLEECQSAVVVRLAEPELATLTEGPTVLRLCIDSACTEGTVDGSIGEIWTQQFQLTGDQLRAARSEAFAIDRARISMTITREGTERFSRTWQNVTFAGQFPNGPSCGEVCRVASVDATTR